MPPPIPLQPQFYLLLGGSPAPTEMLTDLRRVEVDLSLYLPDMFTIELMDEELRWTGDQRLVIGQEVQIGARGSDEEQEASKPLLNGEVTAIEATYGESGVPTLVVHGYDRAHRLHRGTQVRSFLQMTDSDIAAKIAQDRGLQAEIDSTSHVHTQITQDNLTDFEFLTARARAVGFVFAVEQRKLIFKKPGSVTRPVIDLNYRENLLAFRPRLTVAAQVSDVTVRGWDPVAKRAVIGRASSTDFRTAKSGWEKTGSGFASQVFGAAGAGSVLVGDAPIASQAEGDALARSVLAKRWADDVRGDGEAFGVPELRAGSLVKIDGVAARFNGEYYVTRVRHTFEAGGEYRTWFSIGGFGADTTADLLFTNAAEIEHNADRVSRGLVVALVTNNRDPENRGRVKVKYPWLGDDIESDWAHVLAPMAGGGRGFFYVPEVNDEVVIGFEHGDFNYPYVIGSLWNGVDEPPITDAVGGDGKVNKRILKTRAGHIVQLEDTAGAEKIEVIDKTGKNKIVIDSAQNTITVESDNEIKVSAKNKVEVKALTVSVEGTQKVELKGAEIEINGSARVKISGGIVEIN